MPAASRPPTTHVRQFDRPSLSGTFSLDDCCTVAGASTVAGVVETFVTATGGATLFESDVAGTFVGLCCASIVGAFCSRSGGSGARVSDGNAFEATGVSTLGEVSGAAAGFSFLASTCEAGGDCVAFAVVASMPGTVAADFCVAVSFGCFADLFDATVAGIGLGSIAGVDSTFAASVEATTGGAAALCSQPKS